MGGGLVLGSLSARRAFLVGIASTLTLLGAGCGGGQSPSTATSVEPIADDEGTENSGDATTTIVATNDSASAAVSYLPELLLEEATPGPRPLLSWAAVDGADRYTLVVLGDDGTPYWAWSGTETTIHFGGFDDPDAIGPWVHEAMTWTVAATDAAGKPLAISQAGILTP